MAEPPKPKRPSRSKKVQEPDFSPFENWLIDGPAGVWPAPWDALAEYSEEQSRIIADNARDLGQRKVWFEKVQAFEALLSALADDAQRKQKRGKYHIRFDRHEFGDQESQFHQYSFPCSVSFYESMFHGAVSFINTKFSEGDVSFERANFGNALVFFSGAKFGEGEVSFDGASFGRGNVSFGGVQFGEGDVSFRGATFGGKKVSFDGAAFSKGNVSFLETNFGNGDVGFDDVNFGEGDVLFTATIFGEGSLTFDKARFGVGEVSFYEVSMRATTAMATRVTVAENLSFVDNTCGQFDFSQLKVEGTANFSGSSFDKVPDFRDAKFDRPPEVAGMVVPRPKLEGWNSLAIDREDVAKYRKLKSMALAANDHEKDGEFFAGEMLAKRGTETTSSTGLLFNTLYWKLSDFGQAFPLPVWWMFRTILLFAAVNVAVISIGMPATLATISSRFDAMAFSTFLSLKNSIPLLGSLFRFAPAPQDHKSWFQTYYDTLEASPATVDWLIGLGVVENILGGVLLFLFLLALRNKFRLK